jgi:hypothetical protein
LGDQIEKNEMGGALARMRKRRGIYMVLVGETEGKKPLERQGVDGKTILRWIFTKLDVGHGLDRAGSE